MKTFNGGWKLDADMWLFRKVQPMDGPLLVSWPDAGFTTPKYTFVRSLGAAEALDLGKPVQEQMVYDRHGSKL